MFSGKINKFKTLNLILVKNMEKRFTVLKIRNSFLGKLKLDSLQYYELCNLLFHFTDFCIGQPN